jgi:hypothetical protein
LVRLFTVPEIVEYILLCEVRGMLLKHRVELEADRGRGFDPEFKSCIDETVGTCKKG